MTTPTFMARRLMDQGITQKQIADVVGTRQQNISKLCQGGDCNYMVGKQLEKLYNAVVLNNKDFAEYKSSL